MAQAAPKDDWRSEAGKKGAAARTAKRNQYSDGAKPMHQRNVEDMRARIKTGILLAKLEKDAIGKGNLTDGQRASIKLLIDKALPTLQAVESTQLDSAATRSEAELYADLKALIAAHPDLIQAALAEHAREQGQTVHDAPQQTASIAQGIGTK